MICATIGQKLWQIACLIRKLHLMMILILNHNEEIYIMNADGTGPTRLTDNPHFDDVYPDW